MNESMDRIKIVLRAFQRAARKKGRASRNDARRVWMELFFLCDLSDLIGGEHTVINPHVIQVTLEAEVVAGECTDSEWPRRTEVVVELLQCEALVGGEGKSGLGSVVIDLQGSVGLIDHECEVIPRAGLNESHESLSTCRPWSRHRLR